VLPDFFRTGRCDNVEYQMVCKDGRVIDVLLSAVLHRDPLGKGQTSLAVVTDVTAMKEAERLMAESEARYRLLADNSTDIIALLDRDGARRYVSPACLAMTGYTAEEMQVSRTADTTHPDDVARVLDELANMTGECTVTYRMRCKDGRYIWVETTCKPLFGEGQAGLRLCIVRNVDARVRTERQLQESETRYRLLADNSTDMVFQLDAEMVRRYVSPACRELVGYEPADMVGIKPIDMAHPEDAPRLALMFQTLLSGKSDRHSIINRIRHRDGRWIWVEAQLRALRDADSDAVTGIIGALRDISARKAVEDELADANRRLRALARQDSLTGLANRRAFDEALSKEHLRSRRDKSQLGLIMIDVDHFKRFNDLYGHLAGDDCLRCVGAAIGDALLRPGDLAARYGGEEFAVLLPDTDEAGAALIAERIRRAIVGLGMRHAGNPNEIVTVSAGAASFTCADDDADHLIEAADQALYSAKHSGRNAVGKASDAKPDEPPAATVA